MQENAIKREVLFSGKLWLYITWQRVLESFFVSWRNLQTENDLHVFQREVQFSTNCRFKTLALFFLHNVTSSHVCNIQKFVWAILQRAVSCDKCFRTQVQANPWHFIKLYIIWQRFFLSQIQIGHYSKP